MVKQKLARLFFNKYLYGMIFVVLLPALLLYWSFAMGNLVKWPVPHWPVVSAVCLSGGIFLVLKGIFDIHKYGKGLPMNAYPPRVFVTQGVYAWFPHPIYFGAISLSLGAALWSQSSGGLYIITPVLALMIISLIYGYERFGIKKIRGNSAVHYNPVFGLPPSDTQRVSWIKKIAMLGLIFIPWLTSGYLIDYARGDENGGAFAKLPDISRWQDGVSVIWILPYLYIALMILLARTGRSLFHKVITGILATAAGIYLYLVLPPFGIELTGTSWSLALVSAVTAFWAIIHQQLWSILQKWAEWIANSRRDWLFFDGRFRIINHSLYSGLSGAVGIGIVSYVIGNNPAVLVLLLCALIGAAMFAQVRWGNTSLLRPFGYWGGIMGGIVGLILVHYCFDISLSQVTLAGVLCATFAQAIGRIRCLVQGCCHGVLTDHNLGIRVWQKQSRVVTLSGLEGRYILITQLYSMLFNILLGFLLWSIWLSSSVSNWYIIGLYLIMTGIERFAEDAYRGEKQTIIRRGLKENQWIAIMALLTGILVTTIPGPVSLKAEGTLDLVFFSTIFMGGLITAFAMSMDFPKSNLRFSRLSG
jgi:protein-S-isoprenylcysteine O-methyltransferase Ste14